MPFLQRWRVATPAGDAHQTLAALGDGTLRPGRLDIPLLPLLVRLGREACAGDPPDLVLVATAKGDLPLWADAVLEGRDEGGPAWLARRLAEAFGRPAMAIGAACASGPAALAEAGRLLTQGVARRVLVLAGERLAPFVDEGFAGLKAVDPTGCRPFDRTRAGITLGETAAAVVVDATTGLLRLQGWGMSLDAEHLTAPARGGTGLATACREALHMAGDPTPGLVIAHATGTRANDAAEMDAYATALPGVPVVGWKGGLGHSLGACGLTEVALAATCLTDGVAVPGTLGCADPDGAGRITILPVGNHDRPAPWLSANAGFGGMNAAVVLGHRAPVMPTPRPTTCTGRCEATHEGWRGTRGEGCWGEPVAPGRLPRPTARQVLGVIDPSWGRMDCACRLLVALGHRLGPWPAGTGVVLLTEHGSRETDAAFERGRRASVLDSQGFPYTLASIPVGEASIRLTLRGPGMAVQGVDDETGRALARRLVVAGAPAVLLARIETGIAGEVAWVERYEPAG